MRKRDTAGCAALVFSVVLIMVYHEATFAEALETVAGLGLMGLLGYWLGSR